MSKLRIAVLGAGHLGRIHTRLLKTNSDVEFIGVADPISAAREAAAREFDVACFSDYRELLGKIDAVVVATPTQFHHEVTLDLLHQGIHALVEKPITVSVSQAEELIEAAREKNLALQVGHVERFNPAFVAVRKQIERPKFIEAVRAGVYTFRSTDIGVVLDLMIHDIDLVLSLANSAVVDVEALGVAVLGPQEDMAHARLKFANGCVAILKASRTSFQPQRSMQIFAESSFATIDFAAGTAKVIHPDKRILQQEIDVDALTVEEKNYWKENLFKELLKLDDVAITKGNAIQDEQKDFVAAIQSGTQPQVTGEHGRNALAVAQQILAKIAAYHEQDQARVVKIDHRKAG